MRIASRISYPSRLRNSTSQSLLPLVTLVSPPCVASQTVSPSFLPVFGMKNISRPPYTTSTYLYERNCCRWKYQLYRHQKR